MRTATYSHDFDGKRFQLPIIARTCKRKWAPRVAS